MGDNENQVVFQAQSCGCRHGINVISTAALITMTIHTVWSMALYGLSYQNPFVPLWNVFALLLPIGLSALIPEPLSKKGMNKRVSEVFIGIYIAFTIATIVYTTVAWWEGDFLVSFPTPSSTANWVYVATMDWYTVFTCAVSACIATTPWSDQQQPPPGYGVIVTTMPEEKKRTKKKKDKRMHSLINFIRVFGWVTALYEIALAFYLATWPTPVFVSVNSYNSLLIVGVMTFVYWPKWTGGNGELFCRVGDEFYWPTLFLFVLVGLIFSTVGWVLDITQVETAATYLSATSYTDLFDNNGVSGSIRSLYRYDVGSHLNYFVSMSLSFQVTTVFWIVLGLGIEVVTLKKSLT